MGGDQLGSGVPAGERDLLTRAIATRAVSRWFGCRTSFASRERFSAPIPGHIISKTIAKLWRPVIRYEFEQGMIKKKPDVEELFFPPSLQRIQHYV